MTHKKRRIAVGSHVKNGECRVVDGSLWTWNGSDALAMDEPCPVMVICGMWYSCNTEQYLIVTLISYHIISYMM